jgi:AAA family ATP:ADP antiporter
LANPIHIAIRRLIAIDEREISVTLWSAGYFFFLLAGYYLIRPFRESMGLLGGVDNLQWLYLGTLAAMFAVNPIFAAVVSRFPRRVFIPFTYHFFVLNVVVFFIFFRVTPPEESVGAARVFYVWTSVFNLFAVSVFWSFMADVFTERQGRRLFGFIAVGGTLGAIAGSFMAKGLAESVGPANLLLGAAVLLEAAVFCAHRLMRLTKLRTPGGRDPTAETAAVTARTSEPPPGMWTGVLLVLRTPYLMGICVFIFLFTLTSTFAYFLQANIVNAAYSDTADRYALFASINLWVNVLTLIVQCFLTGRIMTRFGVGPTLATLPSVAFAGFICLALSPVLLTLVAYQVIRRATNFALAKPARAVLFTVLGQDEVYKSKPFIETFVYRGGDVIGAWGFAWLKLHVTGLSAMAVTAVPVAAAWIAVAIGLGIWHRRLAKTESRKLKADS